MFWNKRAQPKEEHPASQYPEMQPIDPRDDPPQGGDAAIPLERVNWSDLPISELTGLPYDPELITYVADPGIISTVRK